MTREEAITYLKVIWNRYKAEYEIERETLDAYHMAIEALKGQTTPTIKLNNQIHLCDSCKYNYPNCPSENEDVLFGNGVGNDNICCCAKYLASADAVPQSEQYKKGFEDAKRAYEIELARSTEAVQGEWIKHKGEWVDLDFYPTKYECSQCHYYVDEGYDSIFCPNCGARMEGGAE